MLKEAKYRNWGYPAVGPEFGVVKYAIKGRECYFSGVPKALYEVTSTINAANDIVKAIAGQEDVAITDLRFFDLQTHLAYDRPEGEFEFDELIISFANGQMSIGWQSRECPPDVLEIFRAQIGQQAPAHTWSPEDARKAGFAPTSMGSPNISSCLEYVRGMQTKTDTLQQMQKSSPRLAAYAQALLGTPEFDRFIVVDAGSAATVRFSVWSRDRVQEN